ncbi:MAG: hypothetical protein HRF49_06910 [bacterium]|jgi:hypothetical protein
MSSGIHYPNLEIAAKDGSRGRDFELALAEYKLLHKKVIASVAMRMAAPGVWSILFALMFFTAALGQPRPHIQNVTGIIFALLTLCFAAFEFFLHKHQSVINTAYFDLREKLGLESAGGPIHASTKFAFGISFAGLMLLYAIFFLGSLYFVFFTPKQSSPAILQTNPEFRRDFRRQGERPGEFRREPGATPERRPGMNPGAMPGEPPMGQGAPPAGGLPPKGDRRNPPPRNGSEGNTPPPDPGEPGMNPPLPPDSGPGSNPPPPPGGAPGGR